MKPAPWTFMRKRKRERLVKKGCVIRSMSQAKRKLDYEDSKLRKEWWQDPANHFCAVCGKKATERHHTRGRTRKLQNIVRWWAALCSECHRLVKEKPKWAQAVIIYNDTPREMPLLASGADWQSSE